MGISAFGASGIKPGVCTSTTRPTSPYTGQIIFETDTAQLRYWDGTIWNNALGSPVGSVQSFAGSTAPTGWLLCAGQAVSRTTYGSLFTVVGTTYGSGDGSTTFNLPDLRGRIPAGKDDMGGSAASRLTSGNSGITGTTLGASGGDERLHQHSHTNTATFSGSAGTTGSTNIDHSHTISGKGDAVAVACGGCTAAVVYSGSMTTGGMNSNASHTHSFTPSGTVSMSNANAGSGGSQNVQPTIVLNYIIKV